LISYLFRGFFLFFPCSKSIPNPRHLSRLSGKVFGFSGKNEKSTTNKAKNKVGLGERLGDFSPSPDREFHLSRLDWIGQSNQAIF
jgi:hypothetical protein